MVDEEARSGPLDQHGIAGRGRLRLVRGRPRVGIHVQPRRAVLTRPVPGLHVRGEGAASTPLTPRQREVLQLIAEGLTTKEIAKRLQISVKTAETHRTNLMRKLGLHSVADLTRYAVRNGIVQVF